MKIALLLALAAAALAQKTRYDGYLMIYYIFTFFFTKLKEFCRVQRKSVDNRVVPFFKIRSEGVHRRE
jgi:hypothetical protein